MLRRGSDDADGRPAGPGSGFGIEPGCLGGVPLLRIRGELDRSTALWLRRAIADQLDPVPQALVLDMSALSAVRLDALPTLIEAARRAGEADIGLYLVAADGLVTRALDAAGVLALFDIHPTADSALRVISDGP